MPALVPTPPLAASQLGRAAHDLGLAGMFGGALYGRVALHPAIAAVSDPAERGEVVNGAWRRYGVVNGVSLAAVLAGWVGARGSEVQRDTMTAAERPLVLAKDGLVAALALCGTAVAIEGMRFGRAAPDGAVPLEDGDHVAAGASDAARRQKATLRWLSAATIAIEAGLIGVNAALAQQNFRRPPLRRRVLRTGRR